MNPQRDANIQSLRQDPDAPVDVLVIGGGIVGAGIARDAALRGLNVVLCEQNDLAFGTSSRSSRLLHGGLRYLEQKEFGLVREASREKSILHKIAPHLAEPLAFVFPTRSTPPWTYWKMRAGVWLYDRLCGENFGASRGMNLKNLEEHLPLLDQSDLTGAVRYFDGMTCDARLVIDNCRAAAQNGARIINYAPVKQVQPSSGGWQAKIIPHRNQPPIAIRALTVVNATGPWADRWPANNIELRLTKGVHLVIHRTRLPIDDALVMSAGDRIIFALPWGDRVIIGTTDTDYKGPTDRPLCNQRDVDYLLDVVNKNIKGQRLHATDILSTWAGLRPLVREGANTPSEVSRSHRIAMSDPGWFDIAGGKLTTYRLMAEQTVDLVTNWLKHDGAPCTTHTTPLLERNDTPRFGIIPPDPSEDIVRHFCQNEWVCTLEDIMLRRTSWRYYRDDHLDLAEQVAQWMASALNLPFSQIQQQHVDYVYKFTDPYNYEKTVMATEI